MPPLLEVTLALIASDTELGVLESEEEPQPLLQDWLDTRRDAVHDIPLGRNLTKWEDALSDLLKRSHATMPIVLRSKLWCCRKIYTDACILISIIQAMLGDSLKAIGSLDHAIIIAGAAGQSRFDIIHAMIQASQTHLPALSFPNVDSCNVTQAPSDHSEVPPLSSSARSIPRLSAPSFLTFQSLLSKQAFIVPGYAHDWPALNEHPWRKASYLRSVSGPGRLVPIEVGNNYLLDGWKQVIMSWDEFLSSLDFEDQVSHSPKSEVYYLAQHDLFSQLPRLRDDLVVPDYAYALQSNQPYHVPPQNDSQLLINSWLGPKGTISPPHTDPHNNLYVQVVGQKTIWLAPPTEDVSAVMSGPSESPTLRNTSRCDVFAEKVDAPIAEVALQAMSATLNPGDLLYFPAGWWHAMRSDSTSYSVSFWF